MHKTYFNLLFNLFYDFFLSFQKECTYVKILLNKDTYKSRGTPKVNSRQY